MKSLIVYYSYEGNCEEIAKEIGLVLMLRQLIHF